MEVRTHLNVKHTRKSQSDVHARNGEGQEVRHRCDMK